VSPADQPRKKESEKKLKWGLKATVAGTERIRKDNTRTGLADWAQLSQKKEDAGANNAYSNVMVDRIPVGGYELGKTRE